MKTGFILYAVLFATAASAVDLPPIAGGTSPGGYCVVGSRYDERSIGGFGKSDNNPKKVTSIKQGAPGKLSLVALPKDSVSFRATNQGFRLLLVNRTNAEIPFLAENSTLFVVCEALDRDGTWKPIEFMPKSFCGNSYHRVFLPGQHYWEFAAPVYSGEYRTLLRYALVNEKNQDPLYSNEIVGNIAPSLFLDPSRPVRPAIPKGVFKPPPSNLKSLMEAMSK